MDCNDLDKGPVKTVREVLLTLGEMESPVMGDMECKRSYAKGTDVFAVSGLSVGGEEAGCSYICEAAERVGGARSC